MSSIDDEIVRAKMRKLRVSTFEPVGFDRPQVTTNAARSNETQRETYGEDRPN